MVVVLVVWVGVAGVRLLSARDHAQRGLDELRAAQRQLDPAALIRGRDLPQLRRAEAEFAKASDAADSPVVSPLTVVPWVGRQVRSVRALTGGASTVVHVGVDAMNRSRSELDATAKSGPERIALVQRLGAVGRTAAARLDAVGLGPGDALLGPLASARNKFSDQLTKARTAMHDVADASAGIARMAEGSRYLLLAANNGEMRSGSGMLLSAGVLTVQDGKFSLGDMTSVNDLALPPGAVAVTGDYQRNWGWLQPGEEWRYLAMSPQFPQTAALAAQMWKAKTGQDVDGVVALDPVALKALVKVSGPVEVGGKKIDEHNVVRQILLEQYANADSSSANNARREQNGDIAKAIVDQLDQVNWHVADLVDDLRTAARGRHVMFWSSKPEQQRAWKAAGVSGVLPGDGFMVSFDNRAGNKLDQFLEARTEITHTRAADGGTDVEARITAANHTPDGLPRYVQGPYKVPDFQAGEYRGILTVSVPGWADHVRLDGVSKLVAAGPDGTTRVIAGDMDVPRGQTGEYTVRFHVPKGYGHLAVVPSARYPTVAYVSGGHEWHDTAPRDVTW